MKSKSHEPVSDRHAGQPVVAAFLFFLLVISGTAAIAAETSPGQLIATHRQLTAERQRIIGDMQRNLALKRAIEKDYATLAVDTKSYGRDVEVNTRFCRGRFDEPEYRRRKAICEAKQAELDTRQAELERRKRELNSRDAARQKEALGLKASYDALYSATIRMRAARQSR